MNQTPNQLGATHEASTSPAYLDRLHALRSYSVEYLEHREIADTEKSIKSLEAGLAGNTLPEERIEYYRMMRPYLNFQIVNGQLWGTDAYECRLAGGLDLKLSMQNAGRVYHTLYRDTGNIIRFQPLADAVRLLHELINHKYLFTASRGVRDSLGLVKPSENLCSVASDAFRAFWREESPEDIVPNSERKQKMMELSIDALKQAAHPMADILIGFLHTATLWNFGQYFLRDLHLAEQKPLEKTNSLFTRLSDEQRSRVHLASYGKLFAQTPDGLVRDFRKEKVLKNTRVNWDNGKVPLQYFVARGVHLMHFGDQGEISMLQFHETKSLPHQRVARCVFRLDLIKDGKLPVTMDPTCPLVILSDWCAYQDLKWVEKKIQDEKERIRSAELGQDIATQTMSQEITQSLEQDVSTPAPIARPPTPAVVAPAPAPAHAPQGGEVVFVDPPITENEIGF
jgi:hypothetical protein